VAGCGCTELPRFFSGFGVTASIRRPPRNPPRILRNAATWDGRPCLADSADGFAAGELPDVAAAPGAAEVVVPLGAAAAEPLHVAAEPGAVPVVEQPGAPVAGLLDVVVVAPGAVLAAVQHGVVPVGELADVVVAGPGVVLAAGLFGAAAAPDAVPVAVPHDVVQVAEFPGAAVADPPDVPVIAEWAGVDPIAGQVDAAVAAALLPDWLLAMPVELAHYDQPQEAA